MTAFMAARHAADKRLKDAIFGASAACKKAADKYGAAAVTNATIGAIMDDNGKLACLPTIEKIYRELPMSDLVTYAPITGLPDYLKQVVDITFGGNVPEGYTAAVATAGGTGAIHHAIENYAEKGEYVLTSDWYWGTYGVICREVGSKLKTFTLFDGQMNFNAESFAAQVTEILSRQDSLLVILNTPAHNPTGFALSDAEWDAVLDTLKVKAAVGKRISLLVDIAYIDFAGSGEQTHGFMRKFAALPKNMLTMFAFSMSKSYTFYGQRTGALVALSADKGVIDEWNEICKFSSRATWSNINRGAMTLLTTIQNDKTLLKAYEQERNALYETVKRRAAVFMTEAKACGLKALPYTGGFFISVPTENSAAICEKLHDDLIFAVPLKPGIRVAACSVPEAKMHGVAEKMLKAMQ